MFKKLSSMKRNKIQHKIQNKFIKKKLRREKKCKKKLLLILEPQTAKVIKRKEKPQVKGPIQKKLLNKLNMLILMQTKVSRSKRTQLRKRQTVKIAHRIINLKEEEDLPKRPNNLKERLKILMKKKNYEHANSEC